MTGDARGKQAGVKEDPGQEEATDPRKGKERKTQLEIGKEEAIGSQVIRSSRGKAREGHDRSMISKKIKK